MQNYESKMQALCTSMPNNTMIDRTQVTTINTLVLKGGKEGHIAALSKEILKYS
jgi:hypothetical protein